MTLLAELRAKRDAEERAKVEAALRCFGGSITRAAESIGMARTTFYRRLVAYGMADVQVGRVRRRA